MIPGETAAAAGAGGATAAITAGGATLAAVGNSHNSSSNSTNSTRSKMSTLDLEHKPFHTSPSPSTPTTRNWPAWLIANVAYQSHDTQE
jgi:hypothetical protein